MINWEILNQWFGVLVILPLATFGLIQATKRLWSLGPPLTTRSGHNYPKIPTPRLTLQKRRLEQKRIESQKIRDNERKLLIFLQNEIQALLGEILKKQTSSTNTFNELKDSIHKLYYKLYQRSIESSIQRASERR